MARGVEVAGKHILVVEDILDTGATMSNLLLKLESLGAKSIRVVIAFHKRNPKRMIPYQSDYVGFEVPNFFICGYGADYNQKFRDVPHLFVLSKHAISTYKIQE